MPQTRQVAEAARSARQELPHGEHLPLHEHTRAHLVYPASGVLTVSTPLGTLIAPPSRVAWTPARIGHYHRAYGRTDMRVLYIPAEYDHALPESAAVLPVSALVREALLTLTGPGEYREVSWRRLCEVVCDELGGVTDQPNLYLPEPTDPRLRAVTHAVHGNPAAETTLAEFGRQVGASERTLSRLWHAELGMSFRAWRTKLRIQHALILLDDGRSVLDTATACGWSNPSAFIAAFADALGSTPGHYRRRVNGKTATDPRG